MSSVFSGYLITGDFHFWWNRCKKFQMKSSKRKVYFLGLFCESVALKVFSSWNLSQFGCQFPFENNRTWIYAQFVAQHLMLKCCSWTPMISKKHGLISLMILWTLQVLMGSLLASRSNGSLGKAENVRLTDGWLCRWICEALKRIMALYWWPGDWNKKIWLIHYVHKLKWPVSGDSIPQLLTSLYLVKELSVFPSSLL